MVLPKDIKPEDVFHPTGVFFRNPTHKDIADRSEFQSQIVKAITGAQREIKSEVITYTEDTKPWVLPGFPKIREMDEVSAIGLCKVLMRYRPNIYKVHIKLGDYPTARPINNHKTQLLSSFEPRFHTEVGKTIAEILADRTMNVTEVIYTVNNTEPGNFKAVGEVYGGVSEEEYNDDSLFSPAILIEYFSNQ
jgi:hypothetical protein